MDLSLDNVFNVSVSAPGASVGAYNTSNLALLTHEVPAGSFGNLGYKLYVDPIDVATDFGTSSNTYAQAVAVFSQKPNIRQNSGMFIVFPLISGVESLTASAVPASGAATIDVGAFNFSLIPSDTAASIQTKIRALSPTYSKFTVTGDWGTGFVITTAGIYAAPSFSVGANTLADSGSVAVTLTFTVTTAAETYDAAITRTDALTHYFGVLFSTELLSSEMASVATVMSPLRKIAFVLGSSQDDIQTGGKLQNLTDAKQNNTRGLYYADPNGLEYVASYASRGLSVDFTGSNTTLTMHLKDLVNVLADSTMNQTILGLAQTAGADVYASFRGVAKTFTSGANDFFDNIYNILWFVEAIQVAGFNVLATTPTKIPQTENGMDTIKKALRVVCEQAVTNGFASPGTWTSPITFGPQADFFNNIAQRGYYIYSAPIATQAVTDREARKAPLVQIALKYQGAVHSGSVIININE